MREGSEIARAFHAEILQGIRHGTFKDLEKLVQQLDLIQELPHLIDPHVQSIFDQLGPILVQSVLSGKTGGIIDDLFRIVYQLTKLRGAKVIIKFLSNDVSLLKPSIKFLQDLSSSNSTWYTHYIVLLWVSLMCMTPFDLRRFDVEELYDGKIKLVEQVKPIAEKYLAFSGREREAAGILLARLLTRKDVHDHYIPNFILATQTQLSSPSCSENLRIGLLTCICELWKIGDRELLYKHVPGVLNMSVQLAKQDLDSSPLARKLRTKLDQRLALTLLSPNRASWRYANEVYTLGPMPLKTDSTSEPDDPPEDVEAIVSELLESLIDPETIIRYSAAKGIARITSRLPLTFANEIIFAVISQLEDDVSPRFELLDSARDTTWQGTCLALAELCRHGALLPDHLDAAMPLLLLALQFNLKKGSRAIGNAVRDAACYVMWSIMRCYSTSIILPFANMIATSLITVALFDRDITIRRAASAAYQEGVGRHELSTFPNGIAVLSLADFVAVGQKTTTFLELAPRIYAYSAYRDAISMHLFTKSITHWDISIRELAAQALSKIIEGDASILDEAMQALQRHRLSPDVNARHGAILGAAAIIPYYLQSREERNDEKDKVLGQLGLLQDSEYKGPSASMMLSAACNFISIAIQTLCTTSLTGKLEDEANFIPGEVASQYWALILKASTSTNDGVRTSAAIAGSKCAALLSIKPLAHERLDLEDKAVSNVFARKGRLEWIAHLQDDVLENDILIAKAVDVLKRAARIQGIPADDPETRKIAIDAIGRLCENIFQHKCKCWRVHAESIITVLLAGLGDYSIDHRGDIGSIVREASVYTSCIMLKHRALEIFDRQTNQLLSGILQQTVGKIDNLRENSITALHELLSHVEYHEVLRTAISSAKNIIDAGGKTERVFEPLMQVLSLRQLDHGMLREILVTSSSGSKSTMDACSSSFEHFLETSSENIIGHVFSDILEIFVQYADDDRILDIIDEAGLTRLFELIQRSTIKSNSSAKLAASVRLYCALGNLHRPISFRAWTKLTIMLAHRFPNLRLLVAQSLFSVLQGIEHDSVDELIDIILETEWTADVESIKHIIQSVKGWDKSIILQS